MKKKIAIIFVNFITMIRVIGTFLMPFLCKLLSAKTLILYIVILLLTDTIDGILARKLKVSCIFGAFLDAFADKLLIISTLFVLFQHYPIILLPIMGETIIALINTGGASLGSKLESSMLGKLKTWIMGICIVIGFLTIYSNDLSLLITNNNIIGNKTVLLLNYLSSQNKVIMYSLAFITFGCDVMVAFDYYNKAKNDAKKVKKEGINAKNYILKKGDDLLFALFDHDYYINTKDEPILKRVGVEKSEKKNKR